MPKVPFEVMRWMSKGKAGDARGLFPTFQELTKPEPAMVAAVAAGETIEATPLDNVLVEVMDDDGEKVRAWGQIVDWLPEEEKFLVQAFDGLQESVAADKLREFFPQPAEDVEGGFDVAFPASQQRLDIFPQEVYDALISKQYCVIQTSCRQTERVTALNEAEDAAAWLRLNSDFETDSVGRITKGRKLQWASEEPPEDGAKSEFMQPWSFSTAWAQRSWTSPRALALKAVR